MKEESIRKKMNKFSNYLLIEGANTMKQISI